LIPFYAGIYTFIGGDFYHSTSQYEPGLHEDARKILQEIRESMRQTFVQYNKAETIVFDGWKLDFKNIKVHSLKPEVDKVSFSLSMSVDSVSLPMTRVYMQPRVAIPLRRWSVAFPSNNQPIDMRPVEIRGASSVQIPNLTSPPLKVFFPYKITEDPDYASQLPLIFPISLDLGNKIYDFARATSGFPKNVSGSYWRMLYLSAITITTLGYGDLLPITPRARFLVALEAVSGMIVVGMFLNALSQENKR
jgi:hypothetical protein